MSIIDYKNEIRDIITKPPFNYTWNGLHYGDVKRKIEVSDNIILPDVESTDFIAGFTSHGFNIHYPFVVFYPPAYPHINFTSISIRFSFIETLKQLTHHFNLYNMALKQKDLEEEERVYFILKHIRPRWTSEEMWTPARDNMFNHIKRKHDIKRRIRLEPDNVTLGDVSSIL